MLNFPLFHQTFLIPHSAFKPLHFHFCCFLCFFQFPLIYVDHIKTASDSPNRLEWLPAALKLLFVLSDRGRKMSQSRRNDHVLAASSYSAVFVLREAVNSAQSEDLRQSSSVNLLIRNCHS